MYVINNDCAGHIYKCEGDEENDFEDFDEEDEEFDEEDEDFQDADFDEEDEE